jgi:hypothetical protein
MTDGDNLRLPAQWHCAFNAVDGHYHAWDISILRW